MVAGLYIEVNVVCALTLLILIYKTESNIDLKRRHNLISYTMLAFIVLFLMDSIWMLADSHIISCSIRTNYLINIIYFIMSGLGSFLWFLYCFKTQCSELFYKSLYHGIASLPLFALVLLTVNSPLTKWIFYIDESNQYHRGSLYAIQVVVVYSYVFAASILSIYNANLKRNIAYKKLYISFSLFMLFPIISTALQIYLPGYSFASIGITLPCVLVYTTLSESQVTMDGLTMLFNRNWFFLYYADFKTYSENNSLSLIILDIDHLSLINTDYGNRKGDEVVKGIASVLSKLSKKHHFSPVRFGGDEFLLVLENTQEDEAKSIMNELDIEVEAFFSDKGYPFKITTCSGYAALSEDDKYLQDWVARADDNMFIVKKQRA